MTTLLAYSGDAGLGAPSFPRCPRISSVHPLAGDISRRHGTNLRDGEAFRRDSRSCCVTAVRCGYMLASTGSTFRSDSNYLVRCAASLRGIWPKRRGCRERRQRRCLHWMMFERTNPSAVGATCQSFPRRRKISARESIALSGVCCLLDRQIVGYPDLRFIAMRPSPGENLGRRSRPTKVNHSMPCSKS
jgi:hypothetical protein